MKHFFFRQNESCHSDTENDLNDVPMDCENDSSNHVDNMTKQLDEAVESTKASPLPFRNTTRGRRNTNKSIPGKLYNFLLESNAYLLKSPILLFLDEDIDEDKSRSSRFDRRRIRTPFCDDNAVQFAVSASSSEKAENSDIFTVSSDSYLDTDVNNDTVTTEKSRLSADSHLSAEDECSMSDETTVNNESNWRCRSSLCKQTILIMLA